MLSALMAARPNGWQLRDRIADPYSKIHFALASPFFPIIYHFENYIRMHSVIHKVMHTQKMWCSKEVGRVANATSAISMLIDYTDMGNDSLTQRDVQGVATIEQQERQCLRCVPSSRRQSRHRLGKAVSLLVIPLAKPLRILTNMVWLAVIRAIRLSLM